MNSQNFESYVPVYDTVPEKWEEARQFLVEHLKKISNAVNIREIGWFLDEELLSGKQFIPGSIPQQFRTILRKVINFGPLAPGANTLPHGIVFDSNFTLINLYAAATNSAVFLAIPIPNGTSTINMTATNININSAAAFDRCFVVVEYIQET
jgi:hypothetical protein